MPLPSNHFPPWLRTALQQEQAVAVTLSNGRVLGVYPKERRYTSNFDVASLDEPGIWDAPDVAVQPASSADIAKSGEHADLAQLEWVVLWDEVRRNAESRDFNLRYGLARLVGWPDLAQLPDDIVAHVARICALLERKPTAGTLVPMVVDVPKVQGYALLYMLHLHGHIAFAMPAGLSANDTLHGEETPPPQEAADKGAPSQSLVRKLWARLIAVR